MVAEGVEKLLADYPAPDGVDLESGRYGRGSGRRLRRPGNVLILIVILWWYIVMATQFESLKFPRSSSCSPFPFAFTGVFTRAVDDLRRCR